MHVLIADDDAVYRTFLQNLLRKWRYDVTVTCDGGEAWRAIQEKPQINVAILDWTMPEINGYEVCRKIKNDLVGRDIYTILITGSGLKSDMIKVLVAGADDYIIKPFDPLDLKIRLRAAIRIIHLEEEAAELRSSLQKLTKLSSAMNM